MGFLVGIDGGGTKTTFLGYAIENGAIKQIKKGSISPQDYGLEVFKEIIKNTVDELTDGHSEEVCSICIGIPCRGEDSIWDEKTSVAVSELFPNSKKLCVNDCVIGYAGALGLKPGINIVAGTGAIAYGENGRGRSARSNGWSSEFSDEGSCYWLGKKCFELFCKQADRRIPKMALYDIVRSHFSLYDNMEIINIYEEKFKGHRRETAEIQKLLYRAAQEGDTSALEMYESAAYELAVSIEAVRLSTEMENDVTVSYSGGLFNTGDIILAPLQKALSSMNKGYRLQAPLYSPEMGALLMAANAAGYDCEDILQRINRVEYNNDK